MTPVKKLLCVLYVLLAIAAVSCSKGTQSDDCEQCKPMPADKVISLKIGSIDKAFNAYRNDGRENKNNYTLLDAKSTYTNAELSTSLEHLGLLNKIGGIRPVDIVGSAFFVEKDLSKAGTTFSLISSDIKAFFIYYESGSKLNVKVFGTAGMAMHEIPELSAETDYMSYNDFETFANKFFTNGSSAMSAIVIADNKRTGEHKGSRNHFSTKVSRYIGMISRRKMNGGFYDLEHNYGGKSCATPCPRDGKLNCQRRLGTPTCDDLVTDCFKRNLQPYNSYPEGSDPRDPILYGFRDNFMLQSSIGKHFATDFYYVGSVLKDNLNPSIAAESFMVLDSIIMPVVDKLMSAPESLDIIYSQTTKAALITYINHVEALSDDPVFLEMIGELKGNIEYAAGKTVKAVHDELLAN